MESNKEQVTPKVNEIIDFFKGVFWALSVVAALITILLFLTGESFLSEKTRLSLLPFYDFIRFMGITFGALAVVLGCIRRKSFIAGALTTLAILLCSVWLTVNKAKIEWNRLDGYLSISCNRILTLAYAVGVDDDGEFRFIISGFEGNMSVVFNCKRNFGIEEEFYLSTYDMEKRAAIDLKLAIETMVKLGLAKEDDSENTVRQSLNRKGKSYVLTAAGIDRAIKAFEKCPIDLDSDRDIAASASSKGLDGKESRSYQVKIRP